MRADKEVTIYDIARELEISASTVSRALKGNPVINKITRDKVNEYADKMGYRSNTFASNLRRKKTFTIGVIIPRLDSNFMASSLAGMEEVANNNGYNMIISQSHESAKKEEENVRTLYNNRVDGIIASLTVEDSDLKYFTKFRDKRVPIVFFDRIPRETDDICVLADNDNASYKATQHLIDQGCRQLVHVTIKSSSNVYCDRIHGFERAAQKSGCYANILYLDSLSIDSGREAARQIIKMYPRPDGVFISNDITAAGCMLELISLGIKIPEEIAIVGFNNDPICKLISPKLTTTSYPGKQAGIIASERLFELFGEEQQPERKIILETELIIRESSLKISNKK